MIIYTAIKIIYQISYGNAGLHWQAYRPMWMGRFDHGSVADCLVPSRSACRVPQNDRLFIECAEQVLLRAPLLWKYAPDSLLCVPLPLILGSF